MQGWHSCTFLPTGCTESSTETNLQDRSRSCPAACLARGVNRGFGSSSAMLLTVSPSPQPPGLRPARLLTCLSGLQEHITPPSPPQFRIVRKSTAAQIAFFKMNRILARFEGTAGARAHRLWACLGWLRSLKGKASNSNLACIFPLLRGAGRWRCPQCTSPPANLMQSLRWLRTTLCSLYGSSTHHPRVNVYPPAEEWELQKKKRADCIQELRPSEKVIKLGCLTKWAPNPTSGDTKNGSTSPEDFRRVVARLIHIVIGQPARAAAFSILPCAMRHTPNQLPTVALL